ncbi:hypothetical protein VTK56DRAFT_6682 [Thermocarpiscus australiensis]
MRILAARHARLPSTLAMSTVVYVEPYPGWAQENRGPKIVVVTSIMTAIALVFVSARVYSRMISLGRIALDDLIIMLSILFGIVYVALVGVAISYGEGRHLATLSREDGSEAIFFTLVSFMPGIASFSVPKYAVLILLCKILSPGRWHKRIMWIVGVLYGIIAISMLAINFAQCTPAAAQWGAAEGRCWDRRIVADYATFVGLCSACFDFYLAFYPTVVLCRMQLNWKKKLALSTSLGFGYCAGAIACYKTYTLRGLIYIQDYTYAVDDVVLWTNIEGNCVTIGACIPTLFPLVKKLFGASALGGSSRTKRSDQGQPSGPSGPSGPSTAVVTIGSYPRSKNRPRKVSQLETVNDDDNKAIALEEHPSASSTAPLRAGEGAAAQQFERAATQDVEKGEVGGGVQYQLAVIGVTTETTPGISSPGKGTIFTDPVEAIQNTIDQIRSTTNITRLAALTHIGYDEDQRLARETRGLHLIMGGHSHTPLGDFPVAGGPYPTIVENRDGEEVPLEYRGAPIDLTNQTVQDPELQGEILAWRKPFEEYAAQEVGYTNVLLDQSTCQQGGGLLGDLIADAMLTYRLNTSTSPEKPRPLSPSPTPAASGRASTSAPSRAATSSRPSPLATPSSDVTMSGQKLWDTLEGIITKANLDNGRAVTSFLQVSRGVRIEYATPAPAPAPAAAGNSSAQLVSIRIGDAPLDRAAQYRLVTVAFLAGGGDNFFSPPFENIVVLDTQDEVLVRHIGAESPVDIALDGRISTVGRLWDADVEEEGEGEDGEKGAELSPRDSPWNVIVLNCE